MTSMINISLRLNRLLSRVSLNISTGTLMEAGLQIFSFDKPVNSGSDLRTLIAQFCMRSIDEIELQYPSGDVLLDEDPINDELNEIVAIVSPKDQPSGLSQPIQQVLTDSSPSQSGQAALLKLVTDNPEYIQNLVSADPRMQQVMEKNPQIRHALSDPAVLKDLLSMATNKTAYSELMRGHDRQLSNLENIPQGFQQLQRLYQDMDTVSTIKPLSTASQIKNSDSSDWAPSKKITMDPMPNPWKKTSPTRSSPSPASKITKNPPQPSTSLPPTEKFSSQLNILNDMGFTDQSRNIAALEACQGSVNLAIEWLVRHAEEEQNK